MLYLYNIYNILRIVSNKLHDRIFDKRFLERRLSPEEIEITSHDILVKVVRVKEFLDFLATVNKDEDAIKCEFSMIFPARKAIAHYQKFLGSFYGLYMENLEGRTHVMITDTLFNFKFSIPLRELITVEDLGYLYLVKLILKGCYIVHGGFAELRGLKVLFVGLPGSGKTTLALNLLKEGAYVFSDDMTIVCSDGTAYGLPPYRIGLGSIAEEDVRKSLLRFRRVREFLSKLRYLRWLPYVQIDPTKFLSVSVERLNETFPGKITKGYGKPNIIILMNHSSGVNSVTRIPCIDELAEKILYISMREWYYMDANPVLLKYAYFNRNFPFKNILNKRFEIIESFIRSSKAIAYEMTADPRKLGMLITNLIGGKGV